MLSAINTKLLFVVIALLASIASYCAYEKHKQEVEEQKAREMLRPARPDEKRALPQGFRKPLRDYKPK
jgi:hypothetical protein